MIYELRIYDAAPGKLAALNDRFANITLGYFEKHGIKSIAYWTDVVGISGRLTYILGFEDLAHRERAWAAFAADPKRQKDFAETEKDGLLVARVENKIMRPTPYSPLQ
jgi:NIPSNAP